LTIGVDCRPMIGLGCMRLSTVTPRDPRRGIAVIHAALAAGATLLDTADAYCLDEADTGHNERLIAEALSTWTGDRQAIEVATKGGIRRPNGAWVPDGRARHLRAACEASLRALQVNTLELYQLHVVDPRTPLETSVRALAALQRDRLIRNIGLSNVTVSQIETARRIAEIHSVQVSLSVFDDESIRNGVVAYCRDHGIRLIAYRPLGGSRTERLSRDPTLTRIAAEHSATVHEIALAWLLDLGPHIVPIPGATRVATAASIERVRALQLSTEDRALLDQRFPAGKLLRAQPARPLQRSSGNAEVLLVMGMPGAGKSTVAQEFVAQGYQRLNRDTAGGKLSDLVEELDAGLQAEPGRWVLDNTYASRAARNEVITCAQRHGARVRCIQLATSLPDAQINAVTRLLDAHGSLPMPEELRARGRHDHRYFGPDAQFRYQRQLEPPVPEEGFTVETRAFERRVNPQLDRRAVVCEYDGVLCSSASGADSCLDPGDIFVTEERRDRLIQYKEQGWTLLAIAWRPQVGAGTVTDAQVAACFEHTRSLLGVEIDIAYCPHAAGPPVCWCRKPLPGLILQFAHRHRLALDRCQFWGRSQTDRTLAARLGMSYTAAT
jgi:aryl-alcohol dehydrogenase-like predicted oxidoreductase/histidinol phosphatase-like enzyme